MTVAEVWNKVKNRWDKRYNYAILSVCLFGFLAHGFKFFNVLPNYDSLTSYYDPQNKIALGRCFLVIPCGLSSFYELPWVIAMLSILYISLTCICIIELMDIKKRIAIMMTGGFLITFPAVTCIFSFMYTADGYFAALLCVSLAMLLVLKKHKKGVLPAAVLVCFSLGIYQAYIIFAMILVLIYGIKRILFDNVSIKRLFVDFGWTVLASGGGVVLYYILNQILLKLQKVELSSYQGMSSLSIPDIEMVIEALKESIKDFLRFFFYAEKGISLYTMLNIVMTVFYIITVVILCIRKKELHCFSKVVAIAGMVALLPFCTYIYYFFSKSVLYHTTMLECLALVFIFMALIYEHSEKFSRFYLVQWIAVILSGLIIYNFILLANICYTGMSKSYQSSLAITTRMMDRMEQTENFKSEGSLAIIGRLEGTAETTYNYPPDMTGIVPIYIMRIQAEYVQLFNLYCGTAYTEASREEVDMILDSEEYQKMDCWPSKRSIMVIDGVTVIKFSSPE